MDQALKGVYTVKANKALSKTGTHYHEAITFLKERYHKPYMVFHECVEILLIRHTVKYRSGCE